MSTYKSAPRLDNKKPQLNNFYQIEADLFEVAGEELGYPAFKLLVVLIGTKDGFHPSAEFVCKKAAISKSNYSKYRKELIEKGFLQYETNCDVMKIDYDNIQSKISRLTDETRLPDENIDDNSRHPDEDIRLPDESTRPTDEKSRLPESHNKETENLTEKKQMVVDAVSNLESEYKSKVDLYCVQNGNEAFETVKRLRSGGRSNQWIYKALTADKVNWTKGYGLLFGGSDACKRFRRSIDAKIVTPVEYVPHEAAEPFHVKLPISNGNKSSSTLADLNSIFDE